MASPIGGYYPTTTNTSQTQQGTSSGTSTTSPNPYAGNIYGQALYNALNVASQPYEPYQGQMVAGYTPSQIAASQGFQNAVGMSSPYYTAAQDLYNQGLQYQQNPMMGTAQNYYAQGINSAYNPMTPLAQTYYQQAMSAASPQNYNVQPYMNPYQRDVVDATMRQLEQTEKQALGQNTQQSVLRGSYGGSGQFLGRAEVARQQALSNAQTLAQLNANNYINAQNQYNEQQKQQMQAAQAAAQGLGSLGYQNAALSTQALQNAAQGLGSLGSSQQAQAISNLQNLASGMSGLGTAAQTGYLQSLAALQQSGQAQQQLQQAQLSNAYQQWLQSKAYPYQQLSYLTGMAQGLGPYLGQNASQTGDYYSTGTGSSISMQPYANQSGGGGILGGLTSLLGLGMKAFMPGVKDGGRVEGRQNYASGGSASSDEETSEDTSLGFGALVGRQPYASKRGNYITDSMKLARAVRPAKEISAEQIGQAIASAISGIPRVGGVGETPKGITSSFFGQQESSGGRVEREEGGKTIGELMKTNESVKFNEQMNPTGKAALGFGDLMKQAYADSPGAQLSPTEQGRKAMPDSIYYRKRLPTFGQSLPVASVGAIGSEVANLQKAADVTGKRSPRTGDPITFPDSAGVYAGTTVTPAQKDIMNAAYLDQYNFINNMYEQYLGRRPSAAEAEKWVAAMGAGGAGTPGTGTAQQEYGTLPSNLTPMQVQNWFLTHSTERINALKPVVQGYYGNIADQRINPLTGLFNVNYTGEYYSPTYSSNLEDVSTTSNPYFDPYAPGVPESAHAEGAVIPNIPGKTDQFGNPIKKNKGGRVGRNGGGRVARKVGGETGSDHYSSVYNAVLDAAKRRGAPHPEVLARVGAAQSSLETGGGRHAPNNNYFGIKGPGGSFATMEVVNGRPVNTKASFRGYPTMQHSADDFVRLMSSSPRYKGVFTADTPEKAISAQARSGYATDPSYGTKLALIDARKGGGTGRILPPEPLNLAVSAGKPNKASIMFQGEAPSTPEVSDEEKTSGLGPVIASVASEAQRAEQPSEKQELAKAPEMDITPLRQMPPMTLAPHIIMPESESYIDKVIASERAHGGRLHFQDGGTDMDYDPLDPDRGTREYRSQAQYGQPSLSAQKSRNAFLREQLAGSAPQYDEAAGNEALDKYGNLGLDAGLGIMALSGIGAPLAAGLSTLKNAYRLGRRFEKNGEPGFGGLIEAHPQAPRGRQPSPGGEPIPMGLGVPREGMSKFESNTEAMRRPGVPGREIYYWSSLRNPQGNRPMNRFEENQANLNWNRFGQYEPNKAPAYYDKYGNVAPPKVNYNGQSQRPISEFEANQGYFTQGIPGRDTHINSVARGPVARGFGTRDMGFTPAELGQELVPMGPRGMSVPPSRLPAGRSNLPTLATGSRGGGNGEPPIYADYRDVSGNILGGPRGGNLVPSTGGGGNIMPPGGGGRPPRNFLTKTATAMNMPPNMPVTSDSPPGKQQLPDMNIYGPKATPPVAPAPKPRQRTAPVRKAPVDNRRYWGDWRDVEPFESDPIGGFLDRITGDVRAAHKPGNINSPMSPYAGKGMFAQGGRAYRDDGGFLGGLGDAFSTGLSNLQSNKSSPLSEGLITAGLGMMASPQHDPLRALGEGGLKGIQAYNTAREKQQSLLDKDTEKQQNTDFMTTLQKLMNPAANPATPKHRGGPARPTYANGGAPQSEGFDPFEALNSIGDTIGSGLSSLGETVGEALMPSASAQEATPHSSRRRESPVSDALITAGLGMMASPAHDPLRALGEGGLRGIQAYETASERQRKEDLLEEQRQQNEEFTKKLFPSTETPATKQPEEEKAAPQKPTAKKTSTAGLAPELLSPTSISGVETIAPTQPIVATDEPEATIQPASVVKTSGSTAPQATNTVNDILRQMERVASIPATNDFQRNSQKHALEVLKFKLETAKAQEKDGASGPTSKGDIKAQEELGKASADQALNVGKAAQNAQTTIQEFATMHQALREGKISTGPLAPLARKYHQTLGEFGSSSHAEMAALEDEMTRLGVKQVMADLGGRLGAGISNADRDAIMEMSLNLSKSPGYNLALLEAAIKTQQRALQAQQWTEKYVKDHGGIDANYMTAYSQWASEQPALVSPSLKKILAKEKAERLSQEGGQSDEDNLPVGHEYVDKSSGKKWRKSKEGSRWDQNNWEEVR